MAFPTWPLTLMGGGVDYVAPGMHTSLRAYYLLGEASGQRNDSHSTNHLTDNNTVTQATGKQGNAAQFTSANSEWLSITDNNVFSVGDEPFTFAFWVYRDTLVDSRAFSKDDANVSREYQFILQPGGTTTFHVFHALDGSASTQVDSSVVMSTATWYYVVAWHDSVGNQLGILVNNTTENTAGTGGQAPVDGGTAFELGRRGDASAYHNGRIDEFCMWGRLLTADEKTYMYNGGLGRTYPLTTP